MKIFKRTDLLAGNIKKQIILIVILLCFPSFPTTPSFQTLGHDWDNRQPLHHILPNEQFFLSLSQRYVETISMLLSPSSNDDYSEIIQINLEELAIEGSPHAVDFIWRFSKGCTDVTEDQAKANLVRDFLFEDVHVVTLGELGINIRERIRRYPSFLVSLEGIISKSTDVGLLKSKLNLALGLSYISENPSTRMHKRRNIKKGWKLIREFENTPEAYNILQYKRYLCIAYGFLFAKILKNDDTQAIDEMILYLILNSQESIIKEIFSIFFITFSHLPNIQEYMNLLRTIDRSYNAIMNKGGFELEVQHLY